MSVALKVFSASIFCTFKKPSKILASIKGSLPPNNTILWELVGFYAAQPFKARKLFLLPVLVEKDKLKACFSI